MLILCKLFFLHRMRLSTKYRNAEFLITTGPGPVPDLDGGNIVFGRVIEGMDTISRISEVPVFSPSEKLQVLNSLAKAVGDDRAAKARSSWGKPIQPVSGNNTLHDVCQPQNGDYAVNVQ